VLQMMEVIADSIGPGLPASVRSGVELLLSDAELQTFPQGLDKELANDRLIAAAVEFQSYGEQVRVAVASEDIGPRQKARRFGIERLILPAEERRRDADT
jgi:predicted ribonuclease YlaK